MRGDVMRVLPFPALLLFACLITGCDKDPPSSAPEQPPPPSRPKGAPLSDEEMERALGLEAGALSGPAADPPPPAGDLKQEADGFTDLEACVRQRARVDAVLGDAIDALGYDTLLRDSCRVIEAVKAKSTAACEPIVASSLRDRCVMSVAVVSGDMLLCPMSGQNHDGLCVALARRDLRLCASAPGDKRSTCRAMLSSDPKKCSGDKRCERMVGRWKGLLPPAESKPELGTKVRAEITEKPDGGRPTTVTVDLSQVVTPATVLKSAGGTRIIVGETSSSAWPPFRLAPDPRLALSLLATPENIKQGAHALGADALVFELLAPKTGLFSSKDEKVPATVTIDMVGTEIGSPVRLRVEVDLGEEHHISLNINTYVRDVVTLSALN
jgi:hypothetical protein